MAITCKPTTSAAKLSPTCQQGVSDCSFRRRRLMKPPRGRVWFQGIKLGCPLAGAAVPGG